MTGRRRSTYSSQIPLAGGLSVRSETLLGAALKTLSPVIDIRPCDVLGTIRAKGKAVSLLLPPSAVVELRLADLSLAAVDMHPVSRRRAPELGPDMVLAAVSLL